jgi:HlyD family secretion protein
MRKLLLAAAIAGLAACQADSSVDQLMGTLERDRIELVAEAAEPILSILVAEGEAVAQDQLLATLDNRWHDTQMAQLQAAAQRAAAVLAEQLRGPRGERIEQAQARLAGARDDFEVQRKAYDRMQRLQADGLASQADLDRAFNSRELARAGFEEAQAGLDELIHGSTDEEREQARASLVQAQAAVAQMQITLDRLAIRAPTAGIVESIAYEIGERPPAGATVMVMLADRMPYARVFIPEPLRARITSGVAARIHVDGIDATFDGTVRYVASDASYTPYYALTQVDRSRLAFLAEIDLAGDGARNLPAGVPVQVSFPDLP